VVLHGQPEEAKHPPHGADAAVQVLLVREGQDAPVGAEGNDRLLHVPVVADEVAEHRVEVGQIRHVDGAPARGAPTLVRKRLAVAEALHDRLVAQVAVAVLPDRLLEQVGAAIPNQPHPIVADDGAKARRVGRHVRRAEFKARHLARRNAVGEEAAGKGEREARIVGKLKVVNRLGAGRRTDNGRVLDNL